MAHAEFPEELAKLTYERLGEIRRVLVDEHSASYRWIMASLLAVNSGGVFAVIGTDIAKVAMGLSAAAFWFGILLAFVTAWLGQVQTRKFIQANSKLEEYWAIVAVTGQVDLDKGAKLEEARSAIDSTIPRWTGIGSFVAFSIGFLLVGISL
ncbi:hypothetical protein [Parerythrobacter lacustris]|uniref:Uncharacterized protein n=1 Tax=Parerythrobacter lacustris TaxID=2969984 RepID=A0ABT1XLZ1_9SPHN|nr:hypothetical protein [Parerythrobacter lacustris]MCR2832684.1 hypothetical protein [Parerythrobacter lacustris]